MHIAIIGAGNVGTALGQAAVGAGHTVTLSAQDPQHAEQVAAEIGATAASGNTEAVNGAELIVLAVPYPALSGVVHELDPVLGGRTVIDVTNPLDETYTDLATDTSAGEEVQAEVPGAHVVKAFNTILASRHQQPSQDGEPLDAFFAGDDPGAKEQVAELARSLGYRPIDVGSIAMARALEQLAFLNISLNKEREWPWLSAWRLVGPTG